MRFFVFPGVVCVFLLTGCVTFQKQISNTFTTFTTVGYVSAQPSSSFFSVGQGGDDNYLPVYWSHHPLSAGDRHSVVAKGDCVQIHLTGGYLHDDFETGAENLVAWANISSGSRVVNELGLSVAVAQEDVLTKGTHDVSAFRSDPNAAVTLWKTEGQFARHHMNFSDLKVYGPAVYDGRGLQMFVSLNELDQREAAKAQKEINNLASVVDDKGNDKNSKPNMLERFRAVISAESFSGSAVAKLAVVGALEAARAYNSIHQDDDAIISRDFSFVADSDDALSNALPLQRLRVGYYFVVRPAYSQSPLFKSLEFNPKNRKLRASYNGKDFVDVTWVGFSVIKVKPSLCVAQ